MTMTPAELGATIGEFWNDATVEWARLRSLQRKIEGKGVKTWMPDNTDLEYKDLFRKASSPWPEFARDVTAQGCSVDGYSDQVVFEKAWLASGMDGRQTTSNRGTIGLGYSYLATLPHDDPDRVVMRPMSALKTYAMYAKPWDEHPVRVLHQLSGDARKPQGQRWMYLDELEVYTFDGDARSPKNVTVQEHGLEHTPVARIGATYDDVPQSLIAPSFPIYQRIVDATFTLQMVQRYGAFPQKWAAGGSLGSVRPSIDSMVHAEGDAGESVRFGTFEAADLEKVVKAVQEHLLEFFSFLRVPPIYGPVASIANISAEATAALEAAYFRNIADIRKPIGEGYALAFADAAEMLGRPVEDDAQVSFTDIQTRSLAQAVDAIQKLASLPKAPPYEMLFALVPGWSVTDAIKAAQSARAGLTPLPAPTPLPALPAGA